VGKAQGSGSCTKVTDTFHSRREDSSQRELNLESDFNARSSTSSPGLRSGREKKCSSRSQARARARLAQANGSTAIQWDYGAIYRAAHVLPHQEPS
jgi:hypothetical protein